MAANAPDVPGRVGPLTLTFALAKQNDDANHIHYPEEKIMIG